MLNTDMCLFYQENTLHAKCMDENGRHKGRRVCIPLERKGGFLNAKDHSCCAWMQQSHLMKVGVIENGNEDYCGLSAEDFTALNNQKWGKDAIIRSKLERMRPECCTHERADSFGDCDSFRWPKGPAMNHMIKFVKDTDVFYKAYLKAWKQATENGWKLKNLA